MMCVNMQAGGNLHGHAATLYSKVCTGVDPAAPAWAFGEPDKSTAATVARAVAMRAANLMDDVNSSC